MESVEARLLCVSLEGDMATVSGLCFLACGCHLCCLGAQMCACVLVRMQICMCAWLFLWHVCGLSETYQPTLMFLCLYEFHTTHVNALALQRRSAPSLYFHFWVNGPIFRRAHGLRESSLSQMIYRVSGLDEPPLDVSPTLARAAIRQCRLQYTEPYVGLRVPRTEAKALPRHSGRKFSSLYI